MASPNDAALLLTIVETVALIGLLGVGAQWLAWRLQLPAIVLMSVAGLLVGPAASFLFGQAIVDPELAFGELMRPIVSLAVAIILFEGGLALKFSDLKEAGPAVRRLVFFWRPSGLVSGNTRLLLYRRAWSGYGHPACRYPDCDGSDSYHAPAQTVQTRWPGGQISEMGGDCQ